MTQSPTKPEIAIELTTLQSLSVIVAVQEVERLQRQAARVHDEIFGEIAREHHAEIAEFVASPEVAPLRSAEGLVGLRILRIEDHEGKPSRIVFGVAQSLPLPTR